MAIYFNPPPFIFHRHLTETKEFTCKLRDNDLMFWHGIWRIIKRKHFKNWVGGDHLNDVFQDEVVDIHHEILKWLRDRNIPESHLDWNDDERSLFLLTWG